MARQSKEDRSVPEGRRKTSRTGGDECPRGGKAIPVNEETGQLGLHFETAEGAKPQGKAVDGGAARHRREAATRAMPKSKGKEKKATSATMEEVTQNLRDAFQNVARNKGAAGPDGHRIEEVREHLDELVSTLSRALLNGSYKPGDIRRVWIPKSNGGQRGLGIPNVVDRMVAEAVRQVLEPLYEPTFHPASHGFRPGRSCQTAIAMAQGYLEEGYEVVVDLDLEKFFDRVPHQRLMARLAQRVQDRRLLVLIGKMLKAKVVMPDGLRVANDEGVPQGGPLSPLLSNVVLDELDRELARRGHRFVRYADDSNIYVRSERAGERVMASVVQFIEKRMRLKVNMAKSAVARAGERHFLGFSLRREPQEGDVEVLPSKRSKERIDERIRELTPRNWGGSLRACIAQLNGYLAGWLNFFAICTVGFERTLRGLDARIRRRLRAIQLKHWKTKRTITRNLIRLGIHRTKAWRRVYEGRKSIWPLSHLPIVDNALRKAFFADRGLLSLVDTWSAKPRTIAAPTQLELALG
jgi:group II intron reverse transcriptase/maturase